jgi:acetyl-CoA synthetase
MPSYEDACRSFRWADARRQLEGLPGGRGINIAHEALDRHVRAGRGERRALRAISKSGQRRDFTYSEVTDASARFAGVLGSLGVEPGDRVFTLLGRVPTLYFAALGALRHRAVFCPLYSAFGPEPIAARINKGSGRLLVTTAAQYEKKVAPIRGRLPCLRDVILIDVPASPGGGVHALDQLLESATPETEIGPTDPEAAALVHFTSGTTGTPKGAIHVHGAVVAHSATAELALDLHDGDIYWCTADPGWVTGTSYGIIAPLVRGVEMIADEAEFDAERWYRILEEERVSVWYTAPTAIRMIAKLGPELRRGRDFSSLRLLASVGEPLNPEAVMFGIEAFGRPFHDNWWQTETGGIMIANYAAMDIKPGSMGRPLPGIEAAIVRRTESGVEPIATPDVQGELALKAGWPSMFRGYLGEEERFKKCFADGWYLTGDLARRDADGYFWFAGRADDVIKSAGHLIGPVEVENAMLEHPAVAEAGAIGKPDPVAGEVVKVFVTLRHGVTKSEGLELELLAFARTRLGPAVAPREVSITESIPKTRSGKIMRRLLRARELGLPEGDTSTLEGGQ